MTWLDPDPRMLGDVAAWGSTRWAPPDPQPPIELLNVVSRLVAIWATATVAVIAALAGVLVALVVGRARG